MGRTVGNSKRYRVAEKMAKKLESFDWLITRERDMERCQGCERPMQEEYKFCPGCGRASDRAKSQLGAVTVDELYAAFLAGLKEYNK